MTTRSAMDDLAAEARHTYLAERPDADDGPDARERVEMEAGQSVMSAEEFAAWKGEA